VAVVYHDHNLVKVVDFVQSIKQSGSNRPAADIEQWLRGVVG